MLPKLVHFRFDTIKIYLHIIKSSQHFIFKSLQGFLQAKSIKIMCVHTNGFSFNALLNNHAMNFFKFSAQIL